MLCVANIDNCEESFEEQIFHGKAEKNSRFLVNLLTLLSKCVLIYLTHHVHWKIWPKVRRIVVRTLNAIGRWEFKLMWNTTILTVKHLVRNHTDIILQRHEWILIDVVLPCDKNIDKVEQEKIHSCQNLAGLIREIYRTVAQVVPFVVWAISRNSSTSHDSLRCAYAEESAMSRSYAVIWSSLGWNILESLRPTCFIQSHF